MRLVTTLFEVGVASDFSPARRLMGQCVQIRNESSVPNRLHLRFQLKWRSFLSQIKIIQFISSDSSTNTRIKILKLVSWRVIFSECVLYLGQINNGRWIQFPFHRRSLVERAWLHWISSISAFFACSFSSAAEFRLSLFAFHWRAFKQVHTICNELKCIASAAITQLSGGKIIIDILILRKLNIILKRETWRCYTILKAFCN